MNHENTPSDEMSTNSSPEGFSVFTDSESNMLETGSPVDMNECADESQSRSSKTNCMESADSPTRMLESVESPGPDSLSSDGLTVLDVPNSTYRNRPCALQPALSEIDSPEDVYSPDRTKCSSMEQNHIIRQLPKEHDTDTQQTNPDTSDPAIRLLHLNLETHFGKAYIYIFLYLFVCKEYIYISNILG